MSFLPVARGLFRHGYKASEYSPEGVRKLQIASVFLNLTTFIALVVTIYIYNPENTFGDSLIVSPRSTLIQGTFDNGCNGLTPYAVASDTTLRTYVPLKEPGTFDVMMSFQNYSVAEDNYTITATGLPIDGSVITNNQSITVSNENGMSIGNVTIALNFEITSTIRLSGDPDECTSFFTEAVNNFVEDCLSVKPIPIELVLDSPVCTANTDGLTINFFRYDVFVRDVTIGSGAFEDHHVQPVAVDSDKLAQQLHEIYCLDSGGVSLLEARVAPFSCLVSSYRGWLEVLALSFSNATLVYTVVLVVVFYVADRGSNGLDDEKLHSP